ncbi:hypothetical protein LCUFL03_280058 [Latilactobacillus curvatus]|nr:hypothetical protein LCUFL03_280058 [Latilactobacillus curvatus]
MLIILVIFLSILYDLFTKGGFKLWLSYSLTTAQKLRSNKMTHYLPLVLRMVYAIS